MAGEGKGEKWIKHHSSSHKTLLVGEGDFSFAACLARSFGSAENMVATSLDSKESLLEKYSGALAHLEELEGLGCATIHGVDAHTMSMHPLLRKKLFDRIIFNFPHGKFVWRDEFQSRQIKIHQKLVKGFLRSAREMLTNNGEAHVTHRADHPFSRWEIERLAEDVGLSLVEKVKFNKSDYPGYNNKRGYRRKTNRAFPIKVSNTFKFAKCDICLGKE